MKMIYLTSGLQSTKIPLHDVGLLVIHAGAGEQHTNHFPR